MANCENCTGICVEKRVPEQIPYVAHEAAMDRAERHTKRWMATSLVLIVLIFTLSVCFLFHPNRTESTRTDPEESISIDGDAIKETTDEPRPDREAQPIP